MPNTALPKYRATNDQNVRRLHTTSRNIAGTVEQLNTDFVEMGAGCLTEFGFQIAALFASCQVLLIFYVLEVLIDEDGIREYKNYLDDLNKKKQALQKQVMEDKEWIV